MLQISTFLPTFQLHLNVNLKAFISQVFALCIMFELHQLVLCVIHSGGYLIPQLWFLPAVRGWAPAAVRFSHQPPPQHELLVLVHEGSVSQDHPDVVGVEALSTLGAADVDS